jgi:hypothetical protein
MSSRHSVGDGICASPTFFTNCENKKKEQKESFDTSSPNKRCRWIPLELQAFNSNSAESFCEKITGLRFGRDLGKFDFARADVFAKPIIFYGIMLGARCHPVWFKKA